MARNIMPLWIGAPLGALLLLGGCREPSVTHPSWDSLTLSEVETRLRSPTGTLPNTLATSTLTELHELAPALVEVARFVGHVGYVVSDLSTEDHTDVQEQLPPVEEAPRNDKGTWGTSLYLRLACPGSALEPPFAFDSDGEMRLDSPELHEINTTDLIAGGEFLMSFDHCLVGPVELDARVPGRYVTDFSAIGYEGSTDPADNPLTMLALDFEGEDAANPIGIVGFGCGSATTTCEADVRVAAEFLGESGTYVLAFRATSNYWFGTENLSVEIRAKNGVARCTLTTPTTPSLYTSTTFTCDDTVTP